LQIKQCFPGEPGNLTGHPGELAAGPVVKPCSSDKLPLHLLDGLSRQRLKERSCYKPFFGSQGGMDKKEGGKSQCYSGKTIDFDFCQLLYTAIDGIYIFRLRQEDIYSL